MGLLDNLFKPKPESDREKSVENSSTPDPEELHTPASKASPFLTPQQYVPRSSVQIVPPTRGQLQVEVKAAPAPNSALAPKEIVLTLGDVLSRIPTEYLRPGMHDTQRELRFPADGFDADIARGRASVFLAAIVAQCPDVFLPEAAAFDDMQIRLPLQKLVEQIALAPVLRPVPAAPAVPLIPIAQAFPAAPVVPANEVAPEKPAVEIHAPVSVLAPTPPVAPASTDEPQIYLSLAVILKRCPKEIIVQPLPAIDESVRIAFPFPPIERQLATGQVEVSSLRFIAALPLGLMRCFEAKAGIKVPLPLEEIFQNLPGQPPSTGFAARFPAPTPEPDSSAEARELAEKNAKLAEAILLEAMLPPVHEAAEMPEVVAPPNALPVENIISANFAAEPATVPEPEPSKPEFHAPPIPVSEIFPEPEPAKIEMLAMAELQGTAPVIEPPLFEEPKTAPELPVEVAAAAPPILAGPVAPVAPPVEAVAFRRFVHTLPPPVLLRPSADFIEPAPMPAAPPPSEPPPLAHSIPAPEPAPPIASAIPPPPANPVPEPIPAALEPAIPDLPAKNLRIAPPQFRPVVVLPPVVLSAADAPAFIAQAAEPISPPAIPASVANHKPGPLPEIPFEKTEPPAATQPRESHPISEPPITFAEPVRPFMLDGRIPALFGSDSPVALPRLGELLAALPGIKGCILTSRSADAQGGELPAGLDARAVRELSRRMHTALADRAGHVQHLTLEAGHYSLTLFTRGEACVCAVHRARIFLPGVRERFAAVAEELARAL